MSQEGPAPRTVPLRSEWPEPPPIGDAGETLTQLIVASFRLHGRLIEVAEGLARRGGLTAARWQVLGGVLDEPRSVSDVARNMGMTRQAVQRTADLLVDQGLAEYRPNPAHRRAKLLACTEAGYWAIRRISIAQHPWAAWVGSELGERPLRDALDTLRRLTAVIERRD